MSFIKGQKNFLSRKIIPVIVIEDANDAEPLAETFLKGGIDIIEITFRTTAAAKAIERIRKSFPEIILGAGTIINIEQAKHAINIGVNFGVAPGLNPEIVKYFQENNVLFIPGVMTPSEIEKGLESGCQILKFFPAESSGGIATLKTLAGPYNSHNIKYVPTGGINIHNIAEYLCSPIVCSVGGSWLATKEQIKKNLWIEIETQIKSTLNKLV